MRGQGTGQAGAVDDFALFGRSMGLSQAAVELQVSLLLLLWLCYDYYDHVPLI